MNTLPDLLQGHRGARLRARANGTEIEAPQALLVSNNPYGTGDIAGLGRRARLDRSVLGVVGVTVANARQAVGIISHLLSQVPYKPLPHRDTKLPKRQPPSGYVQPDLPLRYIPTPF